MSTVRAQVELRALGMGDLAAIERIERRAYPTPWSRSMFAGEIVKPTSICVGAFDEQTGALAGYMIVSRYVDAWHLMNIAVAPEHRRRGVARTLLDHFFEATSGHGPPRLHARGARLQRRRDPAVRERRLQDEGHPARLLHGQSRGRDDHVEGPGRGRPPHPGWWSSGEDLGRLPASAAADPENGQ